MCNNSSTVLGLDTCGAEATLALAVIRGGELTLLRETRLQAKTAGSLLTRALRELLGDVRPTELRAIVAVRGPGSFTGMRIGLSAAKALSEAAHVPVIGVSRLAVLAQASGAEHVALDAGRGSLYSGRFAAGATEAELLTADEARAQAPANLVICEEKLHGLFPGAQRVEEPSAWTALRFASDRIEACDWDDAATLEALYLWRPEQMLSRGAGLL